MIPTDFPESNASFGPPPDLDESQCGRIPVYVGQVIGGSIDGARQVITAWKPSPEEIQAIVGGAPIFMSCIGGLPPHFLTTDFRLATNPA